MKLIDKAAVVSEIEKRIKNLYPKGGQGMVVTKILKDHYEDLISFIDSMQEEPVNKDFEMALAEMIDKAQTSVVEPLVVAAQWKDELIKLAKSEEPVSEDLEEACEQLAENARKHKAETSSPFFSPTDYKQGVMDGANWQKENLWKSANGDDLPEYDREVIVLINYNAQCNIHDEEYPTYRVGFGHRPNPNGWDGKNIDTNVITHYTPKLYDKGGWNAPNIVYWLDARLPYEENKIEKEIEL